MSFQQGLSGLNAASKNIEIIGNNVANASTFGAKAARAEFADVYASALNGSGSNPIGIGVNLASVSQQFTQGNITTTANPLDLAINGGGFFQLSDGKNPTTYTRNGQFKIDREGFIVNNQRQQLLGYPVDDNGNIRPGEAQPLQLPTGGIEPRETDRISLELNLDSRAAVTEPPATPQTIDFDDPTTYNNATSVTVYDVKGQPVAITYYFQKAATDEWYVYATANGRSVVQSADGVNAYSSPIAKLNFPQAGTPPINGDVADPTNPGLIVPYTYDDAGTQTEGTPLATGLLPLPVVPRVTLSGGGTSEPIPVPVPDPADPTLTIPGAPIELDMRQVFQYGAAFGVTNVIQTGYAPGQLSGINIESNGILTARYSNGQTKSAGQLELATFRNPQGLQPIGGNGWAATFTSGEAVRGTPGDGNFGVLQAGALEESNVDLTGELVNMITAQRVYQANAQTIKTQDQILQTLVNLR